MRDFASLVAWGSRTNFRSKQFPSLNGRKGQMQQWLMATFAIMLAIGSAAPLSAQAAPAGGSELPPAGAVPRGGNNHPTPKPKTFVQSLKERAVDKRYTAPPEYHPPRTTQLTPQQKRDAAARAAHNKVEFSCTHMTKPEPLPGIPPYSGSFSFMGGVTFPNTKSGPTMTERFRANQPSSAIYDWYNQVFSNKPWTIDRSSSNKNSITATDKDGDTAVFRILSSYQFGKSWTTEFILQYKYRRQQAH